MKLTRRRTVAVYLIMAVTMAFFAESCNIGKKNCGCGMDLNGTMRRKHRWF